MSLYEIDRTFIPPDFNPELLESLPINNKINDGSPTELEPTRLYWTEYPPINPGFGTIGFARRLYLGYPDIAEYVLNYFQKFITLKLDIKYVGLIRTNGNIGIHTDESSRLSCFNLGLKNTDGSTTRVSNTTNLIEYQKTYIEKICFDNRLYLLNTAAYHEVRARNNNPRYMFTYGFDRPYETIKSLLINID